MSGLAGVVAHFGNISKRLEDHGVFNIHCNQIWADGMHLTNLHI
jgi:hypothetical protein